MTDGDRPRDMMTDSDFKNINKNIFLRTRKRS